MFKRGLKLSSVLITHYHPDHCGGMGGHSIEGIAEVLEKEPVKIFVNKHEAGFKEGYWRFRHRFEYCRVRDHFTIGEMTLEFYIHPGTHRLSVLQSK